MVDVDQNIKTIKLRFPKKYYTLYTRVAYKVITY